MRLYLSSYGLGKNPERMVSLLGENKRTAIIMNAQDNVLHTSRSRRLQIEIEQLSELGLKPEELDLRNYFCKPKDLKTALAQFGCFWVRGGNVFLLRRAYRQSGFDKLLVDLLEGDKATYGGFSAGICVLAPSLKGIELVDSKDEVSDGYDRAVIWDGLGVIKYSIAPHYKSDHPESADINKCVDYFIEHNMPYKTLRDGEAIVVNGKYEEILR